LDNKPSDFLERCPFCKEYLLSWQVKEHKCNQPIRTVKEIPVIFSYETSKMGHSIIIAMGFDGVLYRLVTTKNRLTDEFLQRKRTDEDLTEPKNTL